MAQKKKVLSADWKSLLGAGPKGLARAAKTAVEQVLRVKKGEKVLIVTNPEKDVFVISAALYEAAMARGADVNIMVQPRRTSLDMASDAVIHAIRSEPDVVMSISADKLGKDRFGLVKPYRFKGVKGAWPSIFNALMAAKKMRSFWSPSVTLDTFVRTVAVDYAKMRKDAKKIKKALDWADWIRITSKGGSDIEISLRNRAARVDDGSFWKPGEGGNLPAGETYISPANYSSNGVLVFDGSLSTADGGGAFVPKKSVRLEVKDGLVVKVGGGAGAKRFEKSLILGEKAALKMKGKPGWPKAKVDSYFKNARHLGEVGIGLNPKARVTGNMLEDEKILSTCHIAIGSNYDDDAEAFIHLDCIVKKPTIVAAPLKGKEKLVMKNGVIL